MFKNWIDTEVYHTSVKNLMEDIVDAKPFLSEHRDWVTARAHGFGERAFHGMWYSLFLTDLPRENLNLLEVGVYKGQILSLWRLLAPDARITGITPLDSSDGHLDENYLQHIATIHDAFKQPMPCIIKGLSQDPVIQAKVKDEQYDVVYIDGGHTREVVDADLAFYPNLVKPGGYLVIDDACNDFRMIFGEFQGLQPVTDAVLAWDSSGFEFVGNVIHNRIYKRK